MQIAAMRKNSPKTRNTTKRRRNTIEYMKTNFTSIIGPNTRKAWRAAAENSISATMKASEVLQSERMKASAIIIGTPMKSLPASASIASRRICDR